MANNVGIRPRARLDVVDEVSYIGKDNVTAANSFLDACQTTFEFVALNHASPIVTGPQVVERSPAMSRGFSASIHGMTSNAGAIRGPFACLSLPYF